MTAESSEALLPTPVRYFITLVLLSAALDLILDIRNWQSFVMTESGNKGEAFLDVAVGLAINPALMLGVVYGRSRVVKWLFIIVVAFELAIYLSTLSAFSKYPFLSKLIGETTMMMNAAREISNGIACAILLFSSEMNAYLRRQPVMSQPTTAARQVSPSAAADTATDAAILVSSAAFNAPWLWRTSLALGVVGLMTCVLLTTYKLNEYGQYIFSSLECLWSSCGLDAVPEGRGGYSPVYFWLSGLLAAAGVITGLSRLRGR